MGGSPEQRPEKPVDIWNKLSTDAQTLSVYLSIGRQWSQDKEFLEAMAQDQEEPFNLNKGLQELAEFGVLRTITHIQEIREAFTSMKKPDDFILAPITEVPPERLSEWLGRDFTDVDREYLRLKREIEEYERDRDKYPDRYKRWEEPRYKLIPEFQTFMEDALKEKEE